MRVFAYNTLGFSALPGLPAGLSLAPITQPSAPALVTLQALDAAGHGLGAPFTPSPVILATITPPADNGGAPVTAYKVEWDVLGAEAYPSVISPADSLLYSPFDVQAITASASAYGMQVHPSSRFLWLSVLPLLSIFLLLQYLPSDYFSSLSLLHFPSSPLLLVTSSLSLVQGYFYVAFGSPSTLLTSSTQVSVTASADDMKVTNQTLPLLPPCKCHYVTTISPSLEIYPLDIYPFSKHPL